VVCGAGYLEKALTPVHAVRTVSALEDVVKLMELKMILDGLMRAA
jgi:hypothetical protein